MRGRMLMLAAGHKMGQAQAQQQMQAQAQQQAAVEQAKQEGAAQAQAAAPATKDVTAELQKLADLHKSGVLTDEEFAAMKKKLLGL
jgi:membrane protease subunit (stomatin/prohibitin family)